MCKHPASMNRAMIPREQRMKGDLKDGLIRISVGLERARNLVDDLRKSLDLCDDKGCDVLEDLLISIKKYNSRRPPRLRRGYIYIP